jgi:hypothetical protein
VKLNKWERRHCRKNPEAAPGLILKIAGPAVLPAAHTDCPSLKMIIALNDGVNGAALKIRGYFPH